MTAIYNGPLAKQLKIVKFFSLSTSAIGLGVQPILFNHLVAYSGVAKLITGLFCGIFIFITPMFLHLLCKR
jgi:transmembrane protein 70